MDTAGAGMASMGPPPGSPGHPQRPQNPINPAPPGRQFVEHIPATDFAPLYRSIFTIQASVDPNLGSALLTRLAHVNCGYLSTKGRGPTLLELKQHAQALTILIKNVTVSTVPALIDNANSGITGAPSFNDGETYDFLNNLNTAYSGPKNPNYMHHHKMPLTALMNITESTTLPSAAGTPAHVVVDDICPLHYAYKTPINGKSMPYEQHQTLVDHANEILEILDHEYSAKGGLLAILPDKETEKEQYEKSQTTILGQLIQYIQRLVMRIHDLERVYANALDALAGEAAVPAQALSKLGPDGRKGRDIVYPQDRFVLANCGEDLWDWLQYEFEKKENADEAIRLMYKKSGVIGQDMWRMRGQKEYERGITALDVTTRYIRLRKDPLKTVFIIPAHEHHPGTKATREMEKVQTVVSVVKPVWPERASIWEMKNRAELIELKKLRQEYEIAKHEKEVAQNAEKMMVESEKCHRLAAKQLRDQLEKCLASKQPTADEAVAAANKERDEVKARAEKVLAQEKKLRAEQSAVDMRARQLAAKEQAVGKERSDLAAVLIKQQNKAAADLDERLKKVAELEAQAAADAAELQTRLKAVWQKQIADTGAVLALLQLRKVNLDDKIEGEKAALAAGEKEGTKAFDKAVADYIASKKGGRRLGTGSTGPDAEQRGFGNGAQSDSDVDMYG
ncbi:hypothetical protein EG329_010466 [Mollisiaceae sp. DMI_Dod_QoI]|nr:hypothetical protein EG329_010466 [Helotiales sp. DMI_Dod_QoI]